MDSSDYRGVQIQSSVNNKFQQIKPATTSYSKIVQQVNLPTRAHSLITDAIEGISIKDYTRALGNLIGPNSIRFVSRISNGRVCFYVSTQEIVDKLTAGQTKLKIGTHVLQLRPLISMAKRIILSNVCPIIPNSIIEEKLAEWGIKPISQITFIRAGINDPGYTHILSFRRQLYINPDDIKKIKENLEINYDDTTFWIYLSAENPTCFLYKEEGHLAKHCKNSVVSTVNPVSESLPDLNSSTSIVDSEKIHIDDENFEKSPSTNEMDTSLEYNRKVTGVKRALSTNTSIHR